MIIIFMTIESVSGRTKGIWLWIESSTDSFRDIWLWVFTHSNVYTKAR